MGITVAIAGLGLIGGSIALALRKAGLVERVIGISSPGAVAKALELGIVDEGASLESALPQADLVVLSSTIHSIIETIPKLGPHLKQGAIVTDAGSTKRAIVEAASNVDGLGFVGGHPMAGKELSGVEHADADLFLGRPWVLTPVWPSDQVRVDTLRALLNAVGAKTIVMTAAEHDAVVARTSHLPQLLSTALAANLEAHFHAESPVLAGPGLLDATRLAQSSYTVWSDILETNRDEIVSAMADFLDEWKELSTRLASDTELSDQFRRAGEFARRLRE